jgi:hypothetical protein
MIADTAVPPTVTVTEVSLSIVGSGKVLDSTTELGPSPVPKMTNIDPCATPDPGIPAVR